MPERGDFLGANEGLITKRGPFSMFHYHLIADFQVSGVGRHQFEIKDNQQMRLRSPVCTALCNRRSSPSWTRLCRTILVGGPIARGTGTRYNLHDCYRQAINDPFSL